MTSKLIIVMTEYGIHPVCIHPPPYGGTCRTKCLVMRKLEWLGYHMLKTWWYAKPFRHDSGTCQRDRQTDGQTDRRTDGRTEFLYQYRASALLSCHLRQLRRGIKKLSCRSETARCFVSLNISLSHSRSLKIIRNDVLEYGAWKSQVVFHSDFLPFHC